MQTVLVIGGARGIGKAIVLNFLKNNYKVIFTYNSSKKEADKIIDMYDNVYSYQLDLNSEGLSSRINNITSEHQEFDSIVCNSGITDDGFMLLKSEERWENVVKTNLFGPYKVIKNILPVLLRNKKSANKSIIFVSSVSSLVGIRGQTDYCSSKAGLVGLTKSLAHELAKSKIRVNTISPGYINSDMTDKLDPKIKEQYQKNVLLNRFGDVEEVAYLIEFLTSDKAKYINGQNIVIDGGLTC